MGPQKICKKLFKLIVNVFTSNLNLLEMVLFAVILWCILAVQAVDQSINNNICYFLASTNIESIPLYSNWKCVDYIPVTNPCNYSIGQWYGVFCYDLQVGLITALSLDMFHPIIGTFPSQLGLISSLISITAVFNNISGTIPESFCNLTEMYILQLPSNSLSGSIPTCIGNLKELVEIDFSLNKLTGSIPNEIGYLTKLNYLILYGNSLNHTIPNGISNLNSLYNIYLNENDLTGNIKYNMLLWYNSLISIRYYPNIFR